MFRHFLPCLALPLASCATQVVHPTKTEAEQRVDIQACTDIAEREAPFDALRTLYGAYDCLEARGYTRVRSGMKADVQRAMERAKDRPARGPRQACQVPCKPEGRP